MAKRLAPEVNAGSMADIAFLLLIFFLVTTTVIKDKGMMRQLPSEETIISAPVLEKNILEIYLNEAGELLVEDQLLSIEELTQVTIDFLDNGGATKDQKEAYCDFCQGKRSASSSDNPSKAVVAINTNREASYKHYIAVQNAVSMAYNQLRNRESQRLFGYDYTFMKAQIQEGFQVNQLEKRRKELSTIQELFPLLITEAKTKKRL